MILAPIDRKSCDTADPALGRWRHRNPHAPCRSGAGAGRPVEPRRLCRGTCGGRPARRHRPLGRHGHRLGPHPGVPGASLGARFRGRRGDGHRAARHGSRLADVAGTDPSLGRGSECRRTPDRLRRRNRPSAGHAGRDGRGRDRGLRDAMRVRRGGGRADHPDGLARTGRRGGRTRGLRTGLWPASSGRSRRRRSCTGWGRCSTRRWRAIGATPITWPRWRPA